MPKHIKYIAVADPRTFDGDPMEVAERAVRQAAGISAMLQESLKDARLMARNAEMERQLLLTGECDAAEFEESAQARFIDACLQRNEATITALEPLAKAAGFNPRKQVKA